MVSMDVQSSVSLEMPDFPLLSNRVNGRAAV